jgi:HEAT repeat protein
MQQVRLALDPDEVNYEAAATLGPDALPHLAVLVAGDDPGLASKAAYLAGRLSHPGSADVVARAADSPDVRVREAAAAAARFLPPDRASGILARLVLDADIGVQKLAARSIPHSPSQELRANLAQAVERAGQTPIRRALAEALNKIR